MSVLVNVFIGYSRPDGNILLFGFIEESPHFDCETIKAQYKDAFVSGNEYYVYYLGEPFLAECRDSGTYLKDGDAYSRGWWVESYKNEVWNYSIVRIIKKNLAKKKNNLTFDVPDYVFVFPDWFYE